MSLILTVITFGNNLKLIYSDSDGLLCKTPTGASRTSKGGWFQDGWLHVIWKWNKSMCAWECGIRMGWVGKSTIQCWGMMWVW